MAHEIRAADAVQALQSGPMMVLAEIESESVPHFWTVRIPNSTAKLMFDDAHGVAATISGHYWSHFGSDLDAAVRYVQERVARFTVGTRVRFTQKFLQSTSQYTGPDRPTHVGPFARGTVAGYGRESGLPEHVSVLFEDGWQQLIHSGNLEVIR